MIENIVSFSERIKKRIYEREIYHKLSTTTMMITVPCELNSDAKRQNFAWKTFKNYSESGVCFSFLQTFLHLQEDEATRATHEIINLLLISFSCPT